MSEKAKLIRGDPPKIALKRRGSPLKRRFYRNLMPISVDSKFREKLSKFRIK